ncbi:MAG: MBL fold metallo-hydrolase, partial [Sciscionella sp.]
LTATAKAVEQGASTGFEVANILGWTRHQRRFAELDEFNQVMAVNETVAHLEVLVERGWLARSVVDGVVHFART